LVTLAYERLAAADEAGTVRAIWKERLGALTSFLEF